MILPTTALGELTAAVRGMPADDPAWDSRAGLPNAGPHR
jgi:hypothetical protein